MKRALHLLAAVLCALLSGCAAGFDREWKAAARTAPADAFSGRWEGRWRSEAMHGHGGRLRCVFTPLDARRYRARFQADWMLFTSGYTTTFQTKRRGARLRFRGEQDLGAIFGGVYRYEGEATSRKFRAAYVSDYDRGTFEMAR